MTSLQASLARLDRDCNRYREISSFAVFVLLDYVRTRVIASRLPPLPTALESIVLRGESTGNEIGHSRSIDREIILSRGL